MLTRLGTTPIQVRAATAVLEQLREDEPRYAGGVPVMPGQAVVRCTIEHDPEHNEEQKALSRERMRTAVELLRDIVPEARARLLRELGYQEPKRAPRRKGST
jgi:hypothetical protein